MTEEPDKGPTEEIEVDSFVERESLPGRIPATERKGREERTPGRRFYDGLVVVTLVVFLVFTLLITIGAMAIPSIREW